MASETILIVDDAAVTLKLIASLLRQEGYKVQIASNAEQALNTLRTVRPDLILVDVHLPGIDGFELARRIRQDARLKDTAVVAMTASSRQGIEQEATDAGCNGFIAKPIEPHTLRVRVRQYLDREPEAPPDQRELPALPEGFSFSGPEMESLRRAFLKEALLQSRQLLASLDSNFDEARASRLLHQWVGTAGLFGYIAISGVALKMEALLTAPLHDAVALRESLSDLVSAFDDAFEAANTPLPDSMVQELTGKRIALVGFAEMEAERVCAALARIGAKPRSFAVDDPPDCDPIRDCDVVMVHVRPETMDSQWLSPAFVAPTGMPLVLVGAREHLLALHPSVQTRAQEFLIDGWQPEEALMRLRFALSRAGASAANRPSAVESPGAVESPAAAEPLPTKEPLATSEPLSTAPPARRTVTSRPEVLIAEDSLTIQVLVRSVLENYGMECRIAADGTEALRMLREHQPHAMVLDVNMPGLDGFEVLAAIRREAIPVRVILLTARQAESDIIRGFNLGADDYIVKPFSPLELVARLKRLL
jgi:DNA-binding response OmpR family regulator